MKNRLLIMISLLLALVCFITSCAGTPAHIHEYGEWQTVKNPTCTEDGQKERYCSCGKLQTLSISYKGHNWTEATFDEPQICSACGVTEGVSIAEGKYNEALELLNNKSYDNAYSLLYSIKDYAPAKEMLDGFFFAPTVINIGFPSEDSETDAEPMIEYTELHYSYDTNGNISSITTTDNNLTYNFVYDSLGYEMEGYNLLQPYAQGCYHTCTYENGNLIKVTYQDSTIEYSYNENGDKVQLKKHIIMNHTRSL